MVFAYKCTTNVSTVPFTCFCFQTEFLHRAGCLQGLLTKYSTTSHKKKVQYYYVAYWATSEMAMAYCVHAQRGLFCQDFWAAGGRDALFFPLVCARDVCTEVMCKREHVLNSSPKLDSKTSSSPPELPCLLVAASGEPPQSDTVLTPDDE